MADRSDVRVVDVEGDAAPYHRYGEIREVTIHEGACRLAHRDGPMQVPEVRLQQRAAVVVAYVRPRKRVKSPHVGCVRHPKHRHGQRGHERLMEMKDVESLVGDDGGDLVGKVKAQRDPGDGIVGGNGYRGADAIETRLVEADGCAVRG